MISESLRAVLAWAVCQGKLHYTEANIRCIDCGQAYPLRDHIPVLFAPGSSFAGCPPSGVTEAAPRKSQPWARSVLRAFLQFDPPLTAWLPMRSTL